MKLTPRHLAAARLLVRGLSAGAVATRLGISRATMWRWQKDETFARELQRLHERLSEQLHAEPKTPARLSRADAHVADESISDEEFVQRILRRDL